MVECVPSEEGMADPVVVVATGNVRLDRERVRRDKSPSVPELAAAGRPRTASREC